MKKLLFILISILVLNISNVFATSQYVEFLSGEQDDGSIYLESYEDYENALKEVNEQDTYKKEYENMLENIMLYYQMEEVANVVEARVKEVKNIKEQYYNSEYGITKIKYQPITVEILEGTHKGEEKEITYILTADSYENLKIKEVKPNQKINVTFEGEEAYVTTVDSSVVRFNSTIILILITLIFVGIYLGGKGFKMLPQLILLADLLLLVFVPETFNGRSILWLTIITSLAYTFVESVIKVGLNAKTVAAMFSSLSVVLVTTIGLVLFGSIANFSGVTFEVSNMLELFPLGTINFEMLYISGFILMCTIIVSDISCNTVKTYVEEAEKYAKPKVIEYVSNKLPIVFGILIITMAPKLLYTIIAKYSIEEILNSEILNSDITRILFLIIAMTLVTQVAMYSKKLFIEDVIKSENVKNKKRKNK